MTAATTTTQIRGMGYNSHTDTLLGVDMTHLLTIDKITGAATAVGPHGITFSTYIGVEYDAATQTLYAGGDNSNLYSIDMSTGAASLVGLTGLIDLSSLASTADPGSPCGIFCDGFESGDVSVWSTSVP